DTLFACGPVSEYGEIRYGFAWYRNGEWDSVSPDTWDSYFSVPLNEELTYSFEGFYKIGSSYYIHGRMRFSGLTIGIVGSGIYPFAPVTDPVFSEPWWFYSPLMPTLPTNTTVYCAYYNDGTLWVGGDFYDDAYPNLNLIASTENFAVGTDEIIPGLRPVLYPNPGSGRFHITSHAGNSEFNNETEYQLIGLTGQLIERGKVHAGAGGEAVIDLTHQPSGLYHLNVFGTSGTLQFKVIVE
ncbi:MAG: T9SS type A sorting domain-containing protein, partial [Flavobacteriales bacterium]